MHEIADPLTNLSLSITAGGINTKASVRAWKRREEGPGITRRTRLCKGSHVRTLLTVLSLGRHGAALQPVARTSKARQGLIIKAPN